MRLVESFSSVYSNLSYPSWSHDKLILCVSAQGVQSSCMRHCVALPKLKVWTATTNQTTLKWCHQFKSITGLQTRDSITTITISMIRTATNKSNKIREEMEHDNKKVQAHDGVETGALTLQVKNQVGSFFKRVKEIITKLNLDSIAMEIVVSKSPDKDIYGRIGTTKRNNFCSSGGGKREKEKVSKA